ncbi:MAG: hypothetical protein IPM67_00835 [Sphingomonadales bacterium]|jgi:putative SOS response-associated peptidase YedK|nr:hypothetical protein [Sphingomonadales bacterium]MBK9267224.1 hypothetical protein [Sphingomonadales bacterium]
MAFPKKPIEMGSRLRSALPRLVGAIHPKAMPVILHPQDYQRWLDGEPVKELALPFPSQLMAVEP